MVKTGENERKALMKKYRFLFSLAELFMLFTLTFYFFARLLSASWGLFPYFSLERELKKHSFLRATLLEKKEMLLSQTTLFSHPFYQETALRHIYGYAYPEEYRVMVRPL